MSRKELCSTRGSVFFFVYNSCQRHAALRLRRTRGFTREETGRDRSRNAHVRVVMVECLYIMLHTGCVTFHEVPKACGYGSQRIGYHDAGRTAPRKLLSLEYNFVPYTTSKSAVLLSLQLAQAITMILSRRH